MNSVFGRRLVRRAGTYVVQSTRLLGSKRGVPGNPLGTVEIYDDQEFIKNINKDALKKTVHRISKILG